MKIFFSFFLFFILSFSFSYGQEALRLPSLPIEISATVLEYERERDLFIAKGEAEAKQAEWILKADLIMYKEMSNELEAEGNVYFKSEDAEIECERLSYNNNTKEGVIERGRIFLRKGEYYIEAAKIERKGENRYIIVKGGLTTCGFEKPEWKILAKDADVKVGGYAKIKDSILRIGEFPLFYVPYGIFPVKTERQSGFLFPDFTSSSKHGFIIRNSYFLALSEDKDMTFMLDYMSKRGPMFGTEFRYIPREDIKGEFQGFIIDDRKYGGTRYKIEGEHTQRLPFDLDMKFKGIYVSDIEYLVHFGSSGEKREGLLKSTLFFERSISRAILTTEFSHFRTLLAKDNKGIYKYLPFLSFSTDFIPLKDLGHFNLSSELIDFYRERGNTYTRLAIEPKISIPYSSRGINIEAEGTLYETLYSVNDKERKGEKDAIRQTFKIDLSTNLQLTKIHQLKEGRLQEFLRPFLKYTFIPSTSTKRIPFIDPYDRIYRTNLLMYGINHDFYLFSADSSRIISRFEINQSLGIDDELRPSFLYAGYGHRFSDLYLRWNFYPLSMLTFETESTIDLYKEGVSSFKGTLRYGSSARYAFELTHTYTKDLANEVYANLIGKYRGLEGSYNVRYSFKNRSLIDSTSSLSYNHKCYRIGLSFIRAKRPKHTSIHFYVDLIGITSRR